jgi:putative radical SAM enzyme (TIGR03279 family)
MSGGVNTALHGGCVSRVDAHSLGKRLGVQPGDVIASINGHPLRDVIDVRYYGAEPHVEVAIQRDGATVMLSGQREFGEPLGIEFGHPSFDVDIRRCANRCEFCFVAQTPPHMRRALHVKDDDYRYSFLFGQFVTLTNLRDDDWQRIAEQCLSPLYVSVHATEPDLRRRLLGKADAPEILVQLRWLAERHIQVHTQLVLVPGQNDGAHLERSLNDLVMLYPAVRSISVVPVGLTRYHAPGLRSYRPDEARLLLDQVEPWRARCRRDMRLTLVYPSDEWYLLAGRPIPSAAEYDGFGQMENGVGIVRQFLVAWEDEKSRLAGKGRQSDAARRQSASEGRGGSPPLGGVAGLRRRARVVCGTLAAPVLEQVFTEMNTLLGTQIEVCPVANRWYGGGVTVSGLLTGRDVIEHLHGESSPGDVVLLPRVMFDAAGRLTLDDMTRSEISAALGVPVDVVQQPEEVVEVLGAAMDA